MMKLSTAVLVGGQSRRMNGENKAFLKVGQQTFLEQILTQLTEFDETLISVRTPAAYSPFSGLVVDEIKDIGPIGGLYSCLKHCQNEYLFICATDMPFLKKELVEYMLEFISTDYDCFVIQSTTQTHPLCGIYKKSALPMIKQLIDEKNYRMMDLLKGLKTKYIPLGYSRFDESVIANINTLADYDRIKKPALFCVSGIKNSGKTTLITKLIKAFKEDGYRVGVIKHDGHEFEMDHAHTDTYKFRQSGSDGTIIYSQTQFAVQKSWKTVQIEVLLDYLKDMDLIIIEGLKHSTYPKIELVRQLPVCDERHVFAIATAGAYVHETIPTYQRDEIPALVALIKREVLREDERRV